MAQRCILLPGSKAKAVPWNNGRGITLELAIWPASATLEAGNYAWRISKTSITEDGPFSSFAGFDRILVVTHGEGVTLVHAEPALRIRLRALEPYQFSGDWRTEAFLSGGPVQDFNVIHARSCMRAEAEVLRLGCRRVLAAICSSQAFVHVVAGAVALRVPNEETVLNVMRGDSVLLDRGLEVDEVELCGVREDTVAILVRLHCSSRGDATRA